LVQRFAPDPAASDASAVETPAEISKTQDERAAKLRAEREERIQDLATRAVEEVRIFTTGTYAQTVEWRRRPFSRHAASDAAFAVVLLAMFLMGVWFVRSGVMEDTAQHLPFFRKLMLYALPAGIGLGALTSFIAMSHTPGDRQDGWLIARGLVMLGNLP